MKITFLRTLFCRYFVIVYLELRRLFHDKIYKMLDIVIIILCAALYLGLVCCFHVSVTSLIAYSCAHYNGRNLKTELHFYG